MKQYRNSLSYLDNIFYDFIKILSKLLKYCRPFLHIKTMELYLCTQLNSGLQCEWEG